MLDSAYALNLEISVTMQWSLSDSDFSVKLNISFAQQESQPYLIHTEQIENWVSVSVQKHLARFEI